MLVTDFSPMGFLVWSPEFELGVPELDAEHRRLLALVNEFAASAVSNSRLDGSLESIGNLVQASTDHFDFEESIMIRVGYPGYELHREQHSELLASMERLREKIVHEHHSVDQPRMLDFLRDWFSIHIVRSDGQLAQFLRSAAVQDPADDPAAGDRQAG